MVWSDTGSKTETILTIIIHQAKKQNCTTCICYKVCNVETYNLLK